MAAAIDADPAKVGRELGEVIGLHRRLGVTVSDDAEAILHTSDAPIVLHTTRSSLEVVRPQLEACLRAGKNVLSTCEELTYPWARHPDLANALDQLARERRVTLLGTGVNPGFLMDRLPLILTTLCREVRSVTVTRVVDAAQRREPLQRKVGAGLTPQEFQARADAGAIGHVGLVESLNLLARYLGWELESVTNAIEPVIAHQAIRTHYLEVQPGQVAGQHQRAIGIRNGQALITLDLSMYVGASEPRDEISIEGDPPIQMTLAGGVHGDTGTIAVMLNSVDAVLSATPGLLTVADLPAAVSSPLSDPRSPGTG